MRVKVVRPPARNGSPSAASANGATSSARISEEMTRYLPCPLGMRIRLMHPATLRHRRVAGEVSAQTGELQVATEALRRTARGDCRVAGTGTGTVDQLGLAVLH